MTSENPLAELVGVKQDLARLQAENARLREALEWYADAENYRKYYSHDDANDPLDTTSNVQDDAGECARKALGGE